MGHCFYANKKRRINKLSNSFYNYGSLSNWSWDKISEVSKAGKAREFFNIGDTKNIFIDGEQYLVRIIGFDHDMLTNPELYGDGTRETAGITFEMTSVLNNKVTFTNEIKGNLNDSTALIYAPIPQSCYEMICNNIYYIYDENNSSIANYMTTVKKYTHSATSLNIDDSTWNDIFRTDVELPYLGFVLSAKEYGFDHHANFDYTYEYYLNSPSSYRVKYLNNTLTPVKYSTRTYKDSAKTSRTYEIGDGTATSYYHKDYLQKIDYDGTFISTLNSNIDDSDILVSDYDYVSLGFCI